MSEGAAARGWMVGLVDDWMGAAADSFAEVESGEVSTPGALPEALGGSDGLENRLGELDRLDRGGDGSVGVRFVVGFTGSVFCLRSSPSIFNNLVIITNAVLALAFRKP